MGGPLNQTHDCRPRTHTIRGGRVRGGGGVIDSGSQNVTNKWRLAGLMRLGAIFCFASVLLLQMQGGKKEASNFLP